ncbi:unnamed protein product [Effrenium voratum]|nr:unnamed protein product [Effrenium voratum]
MAFGGCHAGIFFARSKVATPRRGERVWHAHVFSTGRAETDLVPADRLRSAFGMELLGSIAKHGEVFLVACAKEAFQTSAECSSFTSSHFASYLHLAVNCKHNPCIPLPHVVLLLQSL